MGDEIRVDGVHALVGHRLQDPGHGRGSDRSAFAGGDLAGIGQRDRVEGARRQLAGEDREAPAELHVRPQLGLRLRRHRRRVDGVRGRHARERHQDLLGHLEADPVLCLGGRGPEVRRQHQVRGAAQRVVGRHRLRRIDVDRGSGEVTGCERIGEGGLVDDPAACDVEDEGARLRRLQLRAPEQVARLRRQRRVDGDDVGPMEELRHPHQLRPGFGRLLLGEVRVLTRGRASRSPRPAARRPDRSCRGR